MIDDIVTRLRKAWDEADPDASVGLTGDAADEIERLRLILTHICDVWGSDLYSITNEMKEIQRKISGE